MARTSVQTGGSNNFQTTSEDLNRVATDILIDGIVGAITNTSGVAPATGGLALNAQGSPNTTTAVTAGIAYVTATPTSQGSQRLAVKIDAQNITHAVNSSGATRYDWVYVKVDATLAANPAVAGDTTGTVFVSRSTSSSVDNGTPPTYGYNIAVVTLANSFASVVNGNIADKRVQTGANNATLASIGPTALQTGAITLGYAQITTVVTSTTSSTPVQLVTGLSVTVNIPAGGRKVKITAFAGLGLSSSGGAGSLVPFGICFTSAADANRLAQVNGGTPGAAGTLLPGIAVAIETPAAGSRTYVAHFSGAGGATTTSVNGNAVSPAFILVEAI